MEVVITALIASLSVIVILTKALGLGWVLRNQRWIDVGVTVGFPFLFKGSTLALFVGIVAGFITTCLLWAVTGLVLLAFPKLLTKPKREWKFPSRFRNLWSKERRPRTN
jgi:hypothetical protein